MLQTAHLPRAHRSRTENFICSSSRTCHCHVDEQRFTQRARARQTEYTCARTCKCSWEMEFTSVVSQTHAEVAVLHQSKHWTHTQLKGPNLRGQALQRDDGTGQQRYFIKSGEMLIIMSSMWDVNYSRVNYSLNHQRSSEWNHSGFIISSRLM